jgi:hypothetical protein
MALDFQLAGLIVVVIWLIVLTIIAWRYFLKYKKIFGGADDHTTASLLQKIAKEHETNKREIALLQEKITKLEVGVLNNIQRVGLIRFNPFKDTGGDQSFILALLDAKNAGIVISGLYSRAGTRWYAKRIVDGKGIDHELSDEEKKAISAAR